MIQPSLRFTLSFLDGLGVLQLEDRPLAVAGLAERLALEIPGLRFPFDLSGGLARFQNRHCRLRELALSFTPAEVAKMVVGAPLADFGIFDPIIELFAGGVRLAARAQAGGHEVDFTARARLRPVPPARLALSVYDLRLYGFLPLPAPLLPRALFAALGAEGATHRPGPLRVLGPTRLELAALELALLPLLAAHGWRLPSRREVALESVEVAPGGVQLHFHRLRSGDPPPADSAVAEDEAAGFAGAEAAILAGDFALARDAYRQAHARTPDQDFPLERLLQLLASSADLLAELEETAQSAAQNRPDLPAVLLALALTASERGQPAQAARHYLRAAELADAAGDSLDAACARRAAAQQQLRAGQGAAATSELERALAVRPDHPGVMRDLRQRLEADERWEDLLRLLWQQAAAASDPAERAAHLSSGGLVLLERLARPDAARERFDQALHLHGEDAGAWEGRGRLELAQAETAAARASLEQAAQLYTRAGQPVGQARVEVALGKLEEAAGATERALDRYGRAAELDADAVEPLLAGGELLARKQQFEPAADLLQDGLARTREPPARARLCRRLAALERDGRRDPVAARRWLEQALRERPADVGALQDMARALDGEVDGERLDGYLRRAAAAARPGRERIEVGRLCQERGEQSGSQALCAEGLALLAAEGGREGAERALALADLAERMDSGALVRRAADALEAILAGEASGGEPLPVAKLANRLATLRLRQGDRTGSEKLAQRALDSYPDADAAAQAWKTIVRCALERGDVVATRAGLAGWAEDTRVSDDPPARAARLVEAAELQRKRSGSAAEAGSLFERALALDPGNRAALSGLAAAAEDREQWPVAEELLRRLIALETDLTAQREQRHRLAEALVRRAALGEEAVHLYQGLLRQDARDLRAGLGLGRALWQDGRLEESVAQFEKVLASDETAPEAHLRLAQAARLLGELASANRHLQQAVKGEPERGAPPEVLIEVLEAFGQIDELVGLLDRRRATATTARLRQTLARQLGGVLERVGRADDAVAVYRGLLESSPDDVASLQRLAEIFRRDARHQELLWPIERLVQLATQHLDQPSPAPPMFESIDVEAVGLELVVLLEESGASSERVETVLRRVLAARPDSSELLHALFIRLDRQPTRSAEAFAALALLYRQNLKTNRGLELARSLANLAASPGVDPVFAISLLKEAVQTTPGDGAMAGALVNLYQRLPDEGDRLTQLRDLLQRSPDLERGARVHIYTLLARAAEQRGDWASAAAELGYALTIDRDPRRRAAHLTGRARLRLLGGDTAQAHSDLQEALAAAPDFPEALLRLADLSETSQEWAQALGLLDRLAAAPGGDELLPAERLTFRRAMAALRAGDSERAVAGLQELLSVDPEHVHAREVLVDVHLRAGNLEGARAELERLTAAHPDRAVAWTALGELYERLGLVREAADALGGLARALGEPRPRAQALLRRGELLRDRLGDAGAAQDAYRSALDADPTFTQAAVRLIETRWQGGHLNPEALTDRVLELFFPIVDDEHALTQALHLLLEHDDGRLARSLRHVLDRRAAEGSQDRTAEAIRQRLPAAPAS